MQHAACVGEVASSLVREFLGRKGLKKTSSMLDEELPRNHQSITNRNELRAVLHLDSLYKENKGSEKPLKTLLEIIAKYFLQHFGKAEHCNVIEEQNPAAEQQLIKRLHLKGLDNSVLNVCDISDDEAGGSSAVSDTCTTQIYRKTLVSISHEEQNHQEDIKLDDVEEELATGEMSMIPAFLPRSKVQVEGKPIDLFQAVEIKKLLFGSSLCCFSDEWKIQSFTFNNRPLLKYGFVQKKGGPCGVLAAVQGCVLQNLLFGKDTDSRVLQPSETQRTRCLCNAIADILWRAGDRERAVVALSSGRQQFSPAGRYKADGILETLILYKLGKYEDLMSFLQQNINQFEFGPYGCILLTLSVVFSRSVELVQKDFDVPTNCLIGAHAYCTQELVNLILTGRSVSNTFNDVLELDSGNGNITLLRGITQRSDTGFLSLFEHYSVCQVGSYLKTPKYPIWVICSESHFSVLFCVRKELMSDWKIERRFDLYYYDGLANQQEEIRLTIDTTGSNVEDEDNDLIPPLEYCIRTKWKGAFVDWNGTEPIL
ncbi:putative ubiquitin carboxyl-terminal hydrolase MINDY-4 isoform X4 [Ascaphus truei]|uniref:putative ubiquitin carboxyl-terminal hydrolase MINDY-4 isoform X4 n=1 Tax=Ascaphus truei TaxID=8439 RepID=UPI003F59FBB2